MRVAVAALCSLVRGVSVLVWVLLMPYFWIVYALWLRLVDGVKAFFDRWMLVHFAFWFVAGANYVMWGLEDRWVMAGITAGGAVAWEVIETGLERWVWKVRGERWYDRWVSDMLMAGAGVCCGVWLVG